VVERYTDRTVLRPGTRLGELEVVRKIAVGGFGIVYLARDHSLDRDVAVKEFMPAQLAARGDGDWVSARSTASAETFALGLQSFIAEAKLLARFSHPAMVKVYRFWEANGTGYMAMPYLRGPTLGDVRRSMSQPPTEAWLRTVLQPLLDALAMLHEQGYYHRDISPENVLLAGAGLPVLLDFGAARRLIGEQTKSITAILKPRYAPIEQYAETLQMRQGPWTDLYALAAVMVFLLDGVPPPASTARSVHDEMVPLSTRQIPGLSASFLRALDWALAVRPQDRPQNVAAWREALDGLPEPVARRRRNRPGHELVAVSSASRSDSYATTVQWVRPVTLRNLGRGAGTVRARSMTRHWKLAVAGVLACGSMASWHLALPRNVMVAAAPDGPTASATVVQAALTSAPKESPATVFGVASATRTSAPTSGVDAVVLREPVHATPRATHTAGPRASNAQKPGGKTNLRYRERTALATSPGPVQLCAGHFFLLRPFCVQSRCSEPQFRGRAECAQQTRPANRYARD
jgi:hypothetical protein